MSRNYAEEAILFPNCSKSQFDQDLEKMNKLFLFEKIRNLTVEQARELGPKLTIEDLCMIEFERQSLPEQNIQLLFSFLKEV